MDIAELAYVDEQDEWKHIHRMANWNAEECTLPAETIEYFVNFSKMLLNEREKLRAESRGTFNTRIENTTNKYLNLTRPSGGRASHGAQSYAEFFKSKCFLNASEVYNEMVEHPILHESEAIEKVSDRLGLSQSKVRRDWKKTLEHPASGFQYQIFPFFREEAQQLDLAKKIAEYSSSRARFATLQVETKIPHSIAKITNMRAADRGITIATTAPPYNLREPGHFIHDDDGSHDSRAYYAEVLAQCVQVDAKRYTAEVWSGILSPLLIFIGEQIVAKLEHRNPRKHWP